MINNRIIFSTAISFVFAMTLGTASISMAGGGTAPIQFGNKSLMIAEARQHDQEKGSAQGSGGKYGEGQQEERGQHRHSQDKEKRQGGHKEREGKGNHGKEKEEGHNHGDKKHGGMKKGGHDYAHMIISHADVLKLSDEQLGKITRLHLKYMQEHKELQKKLKKSMKTFKKEGMKPGTSDAQLRSLGKDFADVVNEMIEYHIKERQAVHAILSDDQKNRLKTMKMDHDEHENKESDKSGGHGHH